jgi:hypothetical protein
MPDCYNAKRLTPNFMCNKYNLMYLISASAAMYVTSALLWDITQRSVVVLYRSFGTTYRSHLQGSRSARRKLLVGFLDS